MIKDFVTSEKPNPMRAVEEYYTKNMKEDLIALWKVWLPSTLLNFAFMPMWARIPWVATTSLVWTCIISAMRGSSDVPLRDVIVGFDSQTMALVTRTIVGAPLQLRQDRSHLLVVLRGPDRPGIVTELTRRLYEMDGSITTSKMMSLGPEFAIMLHVEVPKEKLSDVTNDLSGTRLQAHLTGLVVGEYDKLQISLRHILPRHVDTPVFAAKVWLTGEDKPGLVYRLCEMITEQGLNIEHLQTEQHAPTASSPRLFSTHCHVHGTREPNLTVLRQNIKALERELNVRCDLEVMTIVDPNK
jgi:glycine cleavage system regulatory protein